MRYEKSQILSHFIRVDSFDLKGASFDELLSTTADNYEFGVLDTNFLPSISFLKEINTQLNLINSRSYLDFSGKRKELVKTISQIGLNYSRNILNLIDKGKLITTNQVFEEILFGISVLNRESSKLEQKIREGKCEEFEYLFEFLEDLKRTHLQSVQGLEKLILSEGDVIQTAQREYENLSNLSLDFSYTRLSIGGNKTTKIPSLNDIGLVCLATITNGVILSNDFDIKQVIFILNKNGFKTPDSSYPTKILENSLLESDIPHKFGVYNLNT